MGKDSLASLAKGKNGSKKPVSPVKKQVINIQKEVKTPEEERDLKAKKKVEELLQDVDLEITKKEKINNESIVSENHSTEWLTEQIGLLSEQNEGLRVELAQAKEDYAKLFQEFQKKGNNSTNNEIILQNVLHIYNELQNNYLGKNAEKTSWTTASIPHLLRKMIEVFPFLENYKGF